ncbi:MAG: D-tyrosyl-tRNA(Tyr) deacylase [Kiritimatiellae bacterium]|nr:D-tyrosyl-tRNA(Tyr) deacylase [Kiritimatiellia bacterium]
MKALIQRVKQGSVTIAGKKTASIKQGYVVLLGVRIGDTAKDAHYLARRTVKLRIFTDDADKMNLSIDAVAGNILVISQFTLYADTKKGNRPSFIKAGDPQTAKELYEEYVAALRKELGKDRIVTGEFAADMLVEIANDGPVTIEINTD